ncbi:hypothetical protein FRC12_020965 [Ceratobasidium sp. 428]|nr:hypothetical protein FRC12_020965 [Ceratobasidium sp. 428]
MFLQVLLQKLRGTLRSLRLPRAPKRLTTAFSDLEKLEEFKLTASIPPLKVLEALPPTIQHLAFGIKPKPSRQSLLPSAKLSISSPTSITSPNRPFSIINGNGTNSPRSSPTQTRSRAAAAIIGPSPSSPPNASSSQGTLADVLEYVRKAPALRTVTYSWCTDEGTSDVVALKVLCVERGIDLRCFRHEFGWFSPSEREEMVKCDRFPRYVPVSKAHARVPSIPYAS